MEELKGYHDRRLDLADMIRAVLHIARAYGDDGREQEARQLLERLAAGRFQLALAGQSSRGKTTLMNALLGAAYLPMGAVPMTSVVTTVRYGSRPRAVVRRRGSPLPVEAPLADVARFVAQASAERAELQVTSVEVEIPAEILRLGVEFADTPGIGSAIEVNTATTARFLPQADAVLAVTGFDSPLTQAEAGFLTGVGGRAGKLFVVINKLDLVSARDAAEAAGYVRRWLRDHLPQSEPQVFALSALQALAAMAAGDHERLAASGILALRAALTEFLGGQQATAVLDNVAGRAAGLVTRQRRDLMLGRLGADGGPDAHALARAFAARIDELRAAERAVVQRIAGQVGAGLPGLLAERAPRWQASLQELLAPRVLDALPGAAGPGPAGWLLEDALDMLERTGQELATDWLSRRAAELAELLMGMAAADIGALLELARSPQAVGAALAGLGAGDDPAGPVAWSPEDVPDLTAPRVPWSVPVPPRRGSRRRRPRPAGEVVEVLTAALSAAVSGFTERAREALQAAAAGWVERLGEQAGRETTAAAGRFLSYLRVAPRQEDLAALDDLAARLAAFRASLGTWGPAGAGTEHGRAETTGAEAPAGHAGSCPVCSRMEAVLTEHLRRDQFLLATREHRQARHAQAGGFCPLHTWQYAAIASPLGIAAGYAALAAAVAGGLDDVGRRPGTAGDLAHGAAGLVSAGPCPVCTALAECETSEVTRLASGTPVTAPLCLRHLALVLGARPAPGTGRAMIRMLADTLRRASADMREYALKREALRSGLVTDEESRAHSDVLRLLAGQQALARPREKEPPAGGRDA